MNGDVLGVSKVDVFGVSKGVAGRLSVRLSRSVGCMKGFCNGLCMSAGY